MPILPNFILTVTVRDALYLADSCLSVQHTNKLPNKLTHSGSVRIVVGHGRYLEACCVT